MCLPPTLLHSKGLVGACSLPVAGSKLTLVIENLIDIDKKKDTCRVESQGVTVNVKVKHTLQEDVRQWVTLT